MKTATSPFPVAVLLSGILLSLLPSAWAQDIETVSHGDRVDISGVPVPGKLTVIDFYADWCGPCRSLAPRLERLAIAYPDQLALRKIDIVNWDSAVAAQFRIRSIPHLMLFDENGTLVSEGGASSMMAVLSRRLGGVDGGGETSSARTSPVPLAVLGLVIAVVAFLLTRRRNIPSRTPNRPTPPAGIETRPGGEWFVMIQGSLEGPFSEEDLEEMVRGKQISAKDRARRKGETDWTPVDQVIAHLI